MAKRQETSKDMMQYRAHNNVADVLRYQNGREVSLRNICQLIIQHNQVDARPKLDTPFLQPRFIKQMTLVNALCLRTA